MLTYDWNFRRLEMYAQAFAEGVGTTVLLSISTISFALIVGVLWGISLARSPAVRVLTLPVVDILKSLPPLVLVLFGYFYLSPTVVGFSAPGFVTFTIFVGMNVAAFIADLVRSSITNVPREYLQLGEAFALSERQVLTQIVAPLAIRELLPPTAYLAIETVKLTSLASIISTREMVYVAQGVIVDTSRSLEVWVVVSAIYIALIWPSTFLVRRLETHLKRTAGLAR
jgi:polar amino acid transport system permease protein